MSSMREFRDFQKVKRLKEKQKNSNMPNECEKQFPDCPEKPNKKDCKSCPFYKGDDKDSHMEMFDEFTGKRLLKNPLNKKNLSEKELDDIMT